MHSRWIHKQRLRNHRSTHNREKAASINKGVPPFYEPGLQQPLLNAIKKGYLKCVVNREEAVLNTDITFITVGTPSQPDGSIDLRYIKSSAIEIGEALNKKDTYHCMHALMFTAVGLGK